MTNQSHVQSIKEAFRRNPRPRIIGLASIAAASLGLALSAAPARAVTLLWDANPGTGGQQDSANGSSTTWNTTNNWLNAGVNQNWANSNDASFGNGTPTADTATITLDSFNASLPNLIFQAGPTYTISNNAGGSLAISNKITANGNGIINGTITNGATLLKDGSSSLTLTGGGVANYVLSPSAGTVILSKTTATSAANHLKILAGSATVKFTNSTQQIAFDIQDIQSGGVLDLNGQAQKINRNLVLMSGGSIIDSAGGGVLTINDNSLGGPPSGTTIISGTNLISANLNLGGAATTQTFTTTGLVPQLTISGNITQAVGANRSLNFGVTTAPTGVFTLTGANTYTGSTTVNGSNSGGGSGGGNILEYSTVRDVGSATANSLGTPAAGQETIAIKNNGTDLRYIGSTASSTNRPISLAGADIVLEASGTGSIAYNGSVTSDGSRTIVLSGTGSGAINSNIGTTITTITKNGIGSWTLAGTDTNTGATTINAGSLVLSDANGALSGSTSLTIFGSGAALLLDSTTTNNANRFNNSAAVTLSGGALTLQANSAGTAEVVAGLTVNSGGATVTAASTGATNRAQLTFASLTRNNAAQVNFVGTGGTLGGAAAVDPHVIFTTNPSLVNGVIANGPSSPILGYATVNGTDFAGYDATNGVKAITTTPVSGALVSAGTQNSLLNASGTIAGSTVTYNTLKVQAGSGATLALNGSGNLSTTGILLAGTDDFTIQNGVSGTGGLGGGDARNIYVSDANTTLNVAVTLTGAAQAVRKAGPGFLALTGSSSQVGFASVQNLSILGGTLRGTLTNLGGGTSAGGAFTTVQLRGGVLEISGGGTLTRALDLAGTGSGGGITWDQGATDQGGGGFSAIGGNATVTLVTAVGGATPASLRWADNAFAPDGQPLIMGSTKADSRIDFTNSIGLDNGTAGVPSIREVRVLDNTAVSTDVARLSGVISGSLSATLVKTGAGVLDLTNTNTYTGPTLVNTGTLLIDGSLAAGSAVTISSSATLGGTGVVNGSVTALTGATLAPGDSPGSLEVGGPLALQSGSNLAIELGGASFVLNSTEQYDRVKITGQTTLAGTLGVSLYGGYAPTTAGVLYGIVDATGGRSGTFSNYIQDGLVLTSGNVGLRITYFGSVTDGAVSQIGGTDVVLYTVLLPEPASMGLLALGALLLLLPRRRR